MIAGEVANPRPEPRRDKEPAGTSNADQLVPEPLRRTFTRQHFRATATRAGMLRPAPIAAKAQPIEQPQRPDDPGTMSKAEFYAYCKRTGQLSLFFARFPAG